MTIFSIIKVILELSAIVLLCYGIYREKDLIKFERKVWKYTKAFFKAAYFSIQDKFLSKKEVKNVTPVINVEFEEMLNSLNKNSKVVDFQIASWFID